MKVTKFMSWLKPFLVLSIICGFTFTATAQNYYPATVGNSWVLLSTDGAEQRTYTFEGPETIDGEELILMKVAKETVGTDAVEFDKSWVTVAEDGEILLHQVAFDRGIYGIIEDTYDPPVTNYPAALPLGQTWEVVTEAELQLVGAATITSTIEVVAIEDVETSIGVFKDCVKVETNRKAVTAITIVREREVLWLAPDVGPVKFFDDTRGIVFDLASYNLVEPAAEEMPAAEDMQPTEETTEETTEEATEETTEEITEEVTEETTEEAVEEVTEVEVPAEPTVEEPMMPKAYGFDVTLEPGLNMISIPLMPEKPYTAKSLAAMLEATLVIRLDVTTQQFSAYTSLDEGDGFGIDGGIGYIVNTPTGGMVKFTGKAWDTPPEAADDAPAAPTLSSNKNTWAFVVTSDIRDMTTGTGYILVAKNLRTGTIATETLTSEAKRSSAVWADLNRKSVVEAGDKLEIALYDERGIIVSGPFQRTVSTADIRNAFLNLQLTVGDVQPQDTILAQNYPNPFNPETWIPYQLSKSAEVSIHIHNVAGHLIRTLDLGLKPIGSYMTPSTAAYWDGKNAGGERVASGIYFYTLQTTDFAATRRMVILK
ncbi:MAG: hypothetical protein OXI63_19855 [Candidatus Poribacteria bacterium]|nr:hypothetical protein [Candidatus Poribacteria bacterium]